ncbi:MULTISPECIES: transcription antitermination factor NusB [Thermocrispum]|uniref:transcription antitermination factor NusB n=1 Tax=Thermocrispum sp. TaxID=2060768 RepID=UPI000429FE03|nr:MULTISPECIES: transcription antitermination factor NusB [Thermocrispum]
MSGRASRPAGRRAARQRAVELLYEAHLRGVEPAEVLSARVGSPDADPVPDYAITLVEGVAEHREHIDELLAEYAKGWTIERMPPVDLAVLRMGVFELLWAEDVPDPVAIDEAVSIAKMLSTDDSPRFVNGVLGRMATVADKLRSVL